MAQDPEASEPSAPPAATVSKVLAALALLAVPTLLMIAGTASAQVRFGDDPGAGRPLVILLFSFLACVGLSLGSLVCAALARTQQRDQPGRFAPVRGSAFLPGALVLALSIVLVGGALGSRLVSSGRPPRWFFAGRGLSGTLGELTTAYGAARDKGAAPEGIVADLEACLRARAKEDRNLYQPDRPALREQILVFQGVAMREAEVLLRPLAREPGTMVFGLAHPGHAPQASDGFILGAVKVNRNGQEEVTFRSAYLR